ncbi:MAG: fumarate hydratase [Candidatus Micrarchaeota archaeon]
MRNFFEGVLATAATSLPEKAEKTLRASGKNRFASCISENASIAKARLPLCQDTGYHVIFLDVGPECRINVAQVSAEMRSALRSVSSSLPLRPRIPHPFSKKFAEGNVGFGMPDVRIGIDDSLGSGWRVSVLQIGGGAEDQSAYAIGSYGEEDAEKCVERIALDAVRAAGGKGCPPYWVAVGIGATSAIACGNAERAFIDKFIGRTQEPAFEKRMLRDISALRVGVMGLGSGATALDVALRWTGGPHQNVCVKTLCWALRLCVVEVKGKKVRCVTHPSKTRELQAAFEGRKMMAGGGAERRTAVAGKPFSIIPELRAGDFVSLAGDFLTMRDRAYVKAKKTKIATPVAIYHCGPIVKNRRVIAAGPTTSARFAEGMALMAERGTKIFVGKGELPKKAVGALRKRHAVYLLACGGCGALYGSQFSVARRYWSELGMAESPWLLRSKGFGPLLVAIDAKGRSVFEGVEKKIAGNYSRLLKKMRLSGNWSYGGAKDFLGSAEAEKRLSKGKG